MTQEKTRTHCEQCGTCCRKGGPSLHRDDLRLFAEGILGFGDVVTLRRGEFVHDQITGQLAPLEEELVKLRGTGLSWSCAQLELDGNMCRIYDNRPVECAALKCWDTAEVEAMYAVDRIVRADILPEGHPLLDLVEAHEAECPYERLEDAMLGFVNDDPGAEAAVFEMIDYDANFRTVFRERTGASAEDCDFLFGRPLHRTIRQYGVDIVTRDGRSRLTRMAHP
ncbi:Fe-S-cluster containining protein [Desulfobaculum xiamenense]|uniref:Fe-S-cluster containining protein n=1 Tax=Desulfobaculum xiamenense TaxID=995050 RepID=A0A846QMF0_9BACT|nr:YkgJ family cysteine cluster protein [Desulfobaculum xiamenense]NJB69281.1 Fe-S-cluster containining protein [Desulfobaculum xiamenense]